MTEPGEDAQRVELMAQLEAVRANLRVRVALAEKQWKRRLAFLAVVGLALVVFGLTLAIVSISRASDFGTGAGVGVSCILFGIYCAGTGLSVRRRLVRRMAEARREIQTRNLRGA